MFRSVSLVLALTWLRANSLRQRQRKRSAGMQKHGDWLVEEKGNVKRSSKGDLEFRGAFRDFDLWTTKQSAMQSEGAEPPQQPAWVVEFTNPEEIDAENARAQSLGLGVVFRKGSSLFIEGDVPEKLGYDACGGTANKTVVPVADHEVTPGSMRAADLSKYLQQAKSRNAKNIALRQQVSKDSLRGFIETLQGFKSRNSYTGEGGTLDQAANWAADQLNRFGFTVTRDDFQPGSWWQRRITPQIVAEFRGNENPEKVVVVGAHLDSTSPRRDNAPGADDNGSGSAAILELARIIGFGGVKFKNTLRLVLFTGEEQGLLGSKAIAKRWKKEGLDIICMLNADMLGYKMKGKPITFSLVTRNTDKNLVDVVRTVTQTYMGSQVEIGTSTACCSDQQSFYQYGYPAIAVFETPTRSVAYPQYHKTTDVIEALDLDQMVLHSSTFYASAILFAELAA